MCRSSRNKKEKEAATAAAAAVASASSNQDKDSDEKIDRDGNMDDEEKSIEEDMDDLAKLMKKYPLESLEIKLDKDGNTTTTKSEFPYEFIYPFSIMDARRRRALGIYNMNDSDVTWRVAGKKNFVAEYSAMSNLTRVGITELLTSGQGVKSMSLIYKECEENGWVVNEEALLDFAHLVDEDYEGGHVESPKSGYYREDVVVLDFQSLYPSLMIGNRLCYSTLLRKQKWDPKRDRFVEDRSWQELLEKERLANPDKYNTVNVDIKGTHGTDTFEWVQVPMDDCVLPKILTALLSARKSARALQKYYKFMNEKLKGKLLEGSEDDKDLVKWVNSTPENKEFYERHFVTLSKNDAKLNLTNLYNVLEGRQLAFKLVANSLYGFTGAKKGLLPYPPIARCVTRIGRGMFERTQELAESDDFKATLIYGDTDSVFLIFPPQCDENGVEVKDPDMQRKLKWKIGMRLAARASGDDPAYKAIFPSPCRLELEKILGPLLLIKSKKYAGRLITVEVPKEKEHKNDLSKWKIIIKKDPKITGMECVRRDWCGLTRDLSKRFLQKLLIDDKPIEAVNTVLETLRRLENYEVTYKELAIGKSYRGKDGYAASQTLDRYPQIVVAKQMEREGRPLEPGDRISFVVTRDRRKDISVADFAHASTKAKKKTDMEVAHDKYFLKVKSLDRAREDRDPIDLLWYLDKQISKPFERAVQFVAEDSAKLFRDCRCRLTQKRAKMKDIRNFFEILPKVA